MTISLNVLKELGINLYSNIPAVLSETVANAWDADAERVIIRIDRTNKKITILDNGIGMTEGDINKKYLTVGYQRREEESPKTDKGRHVMGRKGIGKLSLFSIAKTIEIHTVKAGVKNGFIMNAKDILKAINNKKKYHPTELPTSKINITRGTKIILSDLKKNIQFTDISLRRRLARRFGVIGSENKFHIMINAKEITVKDRDYYDKLVFLWTIGEGATRYKKFCKNLRQSDHFDGLLDRKKNYKISGWIGAVVNHGALRDKDDKKFTNNKITVLSWGKLVQEDILEEYGEGGLYSKYLIGEINANFLDDDQLDDISTSNRQKVIEDDPRYVLLRKHLYVLLKKIQKVWTDWRNKISKEKAVENPVIKEWYETLNTAGSRKQAENLFSKIQSLPMNKEEDRKELYKFGILAFEKLRIKENLDELDKIRSASDFKLSSLFNEIDDVEAILYHDIAGGRVKVIRKFEAIVDKKQKERVIQKYIFEHLWLLHPSWDRATGGGRIEQNVKREFDKIKAKFTVEENRARFDIKYRTAAGKHIIVELKKSDVTVKVLDIVKQVVLYKDGLRKCLKVLHRENEPVEVIILIGKPFKEDNGTLEKKEFIKNQLDSVNARIVYYEELIEDSLKSYREYLEKQKKISELKQILDKL